jgi:hypothetical protein
MYRMLNKVLGLNVSKCDKLLSYSAKLENPQCFDNVESLSYLQTSTLTTSKVNKYYWSFTSFLQNSGP